MEHNFLDSRIFEDTCQNGSGASQTLQTQETEVERGSQLLEGGGGSRSELLGVQLPGIGGFAPKLPKSLNPNKP